MQEINLEAQMRAYVDHCRAVRRSIAFVPTMGYLHDGHLHLVDVAKECADAVVVSIYVNPTQFNNPDDLQAYPRDLSRDLRLLQSRGVDAVFFPSNELMYPPGHESWVELERLPLPFEGAGRPGHFRGVSTVVTKLFHLVEPDVAVFGEKDFQQLRIIEKMVADLKMRVRIVRGKLVREEDGLAMSSRNVRLDPENRKKALNLSASLMQARERFQAGEREARELVRGIEHQLAAAGGITLHYCALVEEDSLQEISEVGSQPARILLTAEVGGVRLLDNIQLSTQQADESAP